MILVSIAVFAEILENFRMATQGMSSFRRCFTPVPLVQQPPPGLSAPDSQSQTVDAAEIERIHALVLDLPHIDRREQV